VNVLADTHCHLNLNLFQSDLPDVLQRARQNGVERILVPGIDVATSRSAIQLCEQYPNLSAAIGVHPNYALTWNEVSLEELKALAGSPHVVAIGEIGLDFYRDFAPAALQKDILLTQLAFAAQILKPVIIHSRNALTELWQILFTWHQGLVNQRSPLAEFPGVLHSYDGDLDTALQAIELGFMIGISGPVTFKNAQERQTLVSNLPLESILIETDAPYLTPHPFRGRRNEPGHVLLVAEKIAQLHNRPVSEIAAITTRNANRIFRWRPSD
jgi:TatD DNase family protein